MNETRGYLSFHSTKCSIHSAPDMGTINEMKKKTNPFMLATTYVTYDISFLHTKKSKFKFKWTEFRMMSLDS